MQVRNSGLVFGLELPAPFLPSVGRRGEVRGTFYILAGRCWHPGFVYRFSLLEVLEMNSRFQMLLFHRHRFGKDSETTCEVSLDAEGSRIFLLCTDISFTDISFDISFVHGYFFCLLAPVCTP